MHLTSQRIFEVHNDKNPNVSLSTLVQQLLDAQKRSWPELAAGYDALRDVKTRTIDCHGISLILQFNPGRIKSTGAKLDEESLRSRKCFLCVENLPVEQQGIVYGDEFLVLCNPAPIFDRHFTIARISHSEQSIGAFPGIFLELARDLSPSYTMFYNGPRCGASAPDHLHYQACPTDSLPIETIVSNNSLRIRVKQEANYSIWRLSSCGREAIIVECDEKEETERVLHRLLETMKKTLGQSEEPMLNILCSFVDKMWRLMLFPRSKHRPDIYYRQGPDRVLISPAAVDLAGLIITPLQKDFATVDATVVENIFHEVSLDGESVERILEAL